MQKKLKHIIDRSVRHKILFGLGVAVLISTLIFVSLASAFILRSFRSLEERDVVDNIKRVRDSFDLQLESLENKFIDWSMWDDAYNYVLDGNKEFEESNFLLEQLVVIKFDFFGWVSQEGQWRWSGIIDEASEKIVATPQELIGFFEQHISEIKFTESTTANGLYNLPVLGPSFVTVQQVLPSNGKGQSAGLMIAVRAINQTMINRLGQLTRLDLEIVDAKSKYSHFEKHQIQLIDSKTLKAQLEILSPNSSPVLLVQFQRAREIYQEGMSTLILFFSVFFLIMALLFGVIWWGLKRFVIDRIDYLMNKINDFSTHQTMGARIEIDGHDEIAQLAQTTNHFIQELENAQAEIEKERVKSLHMSKLASLGEMSAGIAHEINNPLAIMVCSLEVLADHREDEMKFDKKMSAILNALKRIKNIVSSLQKFSRSKDSEQTQSINLSVVLAEALAITNVKAQQSNVEIQVELDEKCLIDAVGIEMEQVFISLIHNSIDAVKNTTHPWVRVEGYVQEDQVILRVIDSGHGIEPSIAERIFEPFYTTKDVNQGSGLGLSVVRGIVQEYGGEIFLNADFANTCFEIHFPLSKTAKLKRSVVA